MIERRIGIHVFLLAVLGFVYLIASPAAYGGTSTLRLDRVSVTTVSDAAGAWQYEGGTVWRYEITHIGVLWYPAGEYAATRRMVTGGTDAKNTSMFTLTLFLGLNRNITLAGAWKFSIARGAGFVCGDAPSAIGECGGVGGVSAASLPYVLLEHDGTFSITSTSVPTQYMLTINWTGGGAVP